MITPTGNRARLNQNMPGLADKLTPELGSRAKLATISRAPIAPATPTTPRTGTLPQYQPTGERSYRLLNLYGIKAAPRLPMPNAMIWPKAPTTTVKILV